MGQNSILAFEVGSGSKGEMLAAGRCFLLCPRYRKSLNGGGMSVRCQEATSRADRGAPTSLAESSLPVKILTKFILLTTTSRSARIHGPRSADFDTSLQLSLRGHWRGRR